MLSACGAAWTTAVVTIIGAIAGMITAYGSARAKVIEANAKLVQANAESRRIESMIVEELGLYEPYLNPPTNRGAYWVGRSGSATVEHCELEIPSDRQLILNWLDRKKK